MPRNTTQASRSQGETPTLSRAEEKLLRTIATHDTGDGVQFEWLPRGRYRMTGTDFIVSQRTFYVLTDTQHQLVTDGGNDDEPVRITDAGRAWIAAHDGGAR